MTDTISAGSIVLLQPNNVKAHLVGYASNGDAVLETSGGDFESFPTDCIEPVTPIEPKKISDEARNLAEKVWIIGNRLTSFDTKKTEIAATIQTAIAAARADERNKALEDAANACEERFMKLARGDYLLPDAEPQLNDCVELADAIRAMKVRA